ncbi:hypothetical protein RM543_05600 [Roseicyclus sp. F158]|uniref:Lipoprotein n=1 Tax=Tropicimonas omnivorans TaxID=3075590 RepID=A0ABU3DEM2_9RHOB|nr:hypothetical protein [Roseicyclus sp. F158]MDT0682150.1 hypothetical protein [Roseicyclus sp. F158]
MNTIRTVAILAALGTLSACAVPADKGRDRGIDSKDLSQLQAGIWIDPNGCDHWIIDDGLEGYMDVRRDRYGKPVCSGAGAPNTVVGPFKSGSSFPDPR